MPAQLESAMVMAAGLGRRMLPLTATQPKPLVRVAGKALIDHTLERIARSTVQRVIVNVHYLPDMLEARLKAGNWPFELLFSDEREQLLETGGGMVRAQPHMLGDPVLIANSDNIWTDDGGATAIERLQDAWDAERMDALLLLVPLARATGHRGRGDFHMSQTGKLRRRTANRIAPLVYTGVQLVSHRLLRDPPAGPFSTNILWDRAIGDGRLFGLEHRGQWFDVGTPAAIPVVEAQLGRG